MTQQLTPPIPDSVNEEPVLIRDGYVLINLQWFLPGQGEPYWIKQKVKHSRGGGTADAKDLDHVKTTHLEILNTMLSFPENHELTSEQWREELNKIRIKNGIYGVEWKWQGFSRPFSELKTWEVILPKNETAHTYILHRERAVHLKKTQRFDFSALEENND